MIRRRVFAAILICLIAIGSPFFWLVVQGTPVDGFSLATNLAIGAVGFVALHLRWRARERRTLTPAQAKETFS